MSAGRRLRWLVGAAVVAVAAVGVWLLAVRRADEAPTAVVTRGRLEQTIETTGVLEPAAPVLVTGRVSGRLQLVAVEPGDHVVAGDIVAQIDPAPFLAAREAAERALWSAELALTAAEAARVAEEARSAVEVVAAAQRVADARVALAAAERELAGTAIPAPAAGTVLSVDVVEGQAYAAGAPVATVNEGDRLQVRADLDELDVPRVPPGTAVTVVVDAFPAVELAGRVVRVAPRGEARGGGTVFPAVVALADLRGLAARPGMTVAVRVPVVVVADALRVPATAVETIGERSFVRVVRDGEVVAVEVTTGLRAGGLVEIASGDVREGERVRVGD